MGVKPFAPLDLPDDRYIGCDSFPIEIFGDSQLSVLSYYQRDMHGSKRVKRDSEVGHSESSDCDSGSESDHDSEESSEESEDEVEAKNVPKTLESTREFDDTVVTEQDEEVMKDTEEDDFAAFFSGESEPKVLITTGKHPSYRTKAFVQELETVFPHVVVKKRPKRLVLPLIEKAREQGFSDMIIVTEFRNVLHGFTIVHLPNGPTAHFRLTGVVLRKNIRGHGNPTTHTPELVLNNFTTRLGHSVGRMFASLFDSSPEFVGRRICTFHNQRDFIFFRQHRYVFESKKTGDSSKEKKSVRLQELGPRFTLKLKWLQRGAFDRLHGEYAWKHSRELDTSRRRFFL